MTESIEDLYGWGSWESKRHHARRWAWCVKHREPYQSYWTTAGFIYHCDSCDREWMDSIQKGSNDDSRI